MHLQQPPSGGSPSRLPQPVVRGLAVAVCTLLALEAAVLAGHLGAGAPDGPITAIVEPFHVGDERAGRAAAALPSASLTRVPTVTVAPVAVAPPPLPAPTAPDLPVVAEPEPPAPETTPRIPLVPAPPRLAAFAGVSTWIDLHDVDLTAAEQVNTAAAGGAEAIFVQTARFNSPADIHFPERLGETIELAHDAGLAVIVWYIPDFVDLDLDFRRSQAAMSFVTPRGDRPDAFGLDIEMETVADVPERSRRLLVLSAALRDWTGPDYPMAAIVLPPLQLDLRPSWWPAFPFAELRPYYDVYVPMSYSSFRGTDADTTYGWNLANVIELRARTGDPDLPVHLAGGIADDLPELDAFVAAARDANVLGGGLYDLHTTRPDAWQSLRALRSRD